MADNKDKKVLNVPALRFPEFTEEWRLVHLDEIAEFQKHRISTSLLNNSNYISTENILQNFEGIQSSPSIPANTNVIEYQKGDILLSNIRPYLKKVWFADRKGGCSADVFVLRGDKCDQHFLYYVIASDRFINYVMSGAKGVKMPRGDKSQMEKYAFSIPINTEQRKIAKFLSILDERIRLQNKIIEDLKKLKSAIVEMILCKQGGVLLKLGDVGSFIRGLTYSSEDIAEDINATTVIRANNLNYGNNVSKKDVVYVNKKPTEIQILRKGDIVICMANGSSSLVGKNSYYSFDDRQSTIGAFCGIYRSSQPLVKWLMQSQRYRRLVYQSLQGGNGAIANLNGDDILNMTFYVVEDKKSVSILSALVLIENSIAINEKLQELYSMQKEYLLQHLFILTVGSIDIPFV